MMGKCFSAAALPRLRCPFPAVLHDLAPQAQARTQEWAEGHGLTGDPAVRGRLASTHSARLAGRVAPRATPEGLQLNTDWQTWLFLFDDAYCDESELGARPTEVIEVAARVQTVLETGTAGARGKADGADPDAIPFLEALAELRGRLAAMAGPARFDRFASRVTGYLLALTWEAARRERRCPADLREYRVMRRHGGAVPTCLALIDVINGFELPEPVWHGESLRAVTDATADIACWANDVLSYPKELCRSNQVLSLPAVLARERGLSAPAALAEAARMHDERIADYLRLEAPLLAEGDPAVARYLQDLRSWIAGNLAWSYETGRYGLEIAA